MMDNAIRLLMKLLIIIWYYWISFSFILSWLFDLPTKFNKHKHEYRAPLEIVRRHDFASKKGCHYEIWLIRLEQLTCSKMESVISEVSY